MGSYLPKIRGIGTLIEQFPFPNSYDSTTDCADQISFTRLRVIAYVCNGCVYTVSHGVQQEVFFYLLVGGKNEIKKKLGAGIVQFILNSAVESSEFAATDWTI